MKNVKNVILSSTLLLEDGHFKRSTLTKEEALEWVDFNDPTNFVGHETVKILDILPALSREVCLRYDTALCLKPIGRLDFGKEYTKAEIEANGVEFVLIEKLRC